jgi:hypothetical protein
VQGSFAGQDVEEVEPPEATVCKSAADAEEANSSKKRAVREKIAFIT